MKYLNAIYVVIAVIFARIMYKSGADKQQNKQLKAKAKRDEKHSKNRKLIVNMSDSELRDYLRK